MKCRFRCDQCAHEEWRDENQEPWLCVVCGGMRWQMVAVDPADAPASEDPAP